LTASPTVFVQNGYGNINRQLGAGHLQKTTDFIIFLQWGDRAPRPDLSTTIPIDRSTVHLRFLHERDHDYPLLLKNQRTE